MMDKPVARPLTTVVKKLGTDSRACSQGAFISSSLLHGASVSPYFFHSPYVRGSVRGTDDRSRLSQDCIEPGGRGRVLPRRIAGFSCRRQEICFAGLASAGIRKSDAYAGAAGGIYRGCARDFPADSWGLGKDGAHAYSAGGGKRGCIEGCTANGVETAI